MLLALFASGALLWACAPSTNRFDVLHRLQSSPSGSSSGSYRVTRWEVGAQGSAAQASDGKYTIHKVSVGGSYLRSPASTTTYRVRPGLQGRPDATR